MIYIYKYNIYKYEVLWYLLFHHLPLLAHHPTATRKFFFSPMTALRASNTTALVGLFSSPFNVGRVPRKFGHRRSQFFFQKGGLWFETMPFQASERKTWTTETKTWKNMEKITLRENWCFLLMMNLQPYSDSIPLFSFGSNLSLARGGHGTNLLVARISFHWASPSQRWLKATNPWKFGWIWSFTKDDSPPSPPKKYLNFQL